MSNCVIPGWGVGPWGKTPWGGSLSPIIGGPLPVVLPFDIYCVGPCGPISTILTHPEVMTEGSGLQFPIDITTMDQLMASGGTFPTTDAAMIITEVVPENWTFEFSVRFQSLPNDFSDIINQHIFFGTSSAPGGCAGLFFSKIGLAYTGCIHLNGSGDIALDTPFQQLANSQTLVSENEYWTIRIAMSFSTGAVYIYVTQSSLLLSIGHQLRYILPAIPSSSAAVVPPSQTLVSVRGTAGQMSECGINSICLATGLVVPIIQPFADPGPDVALQLCSVLQLDGSRSFDPQGAPLTYKWRLIDAPLGDQYIFDGADGQTIPLMPPTGFTNILYSQSMGVLNGEVPINAGDVLVVAGQPYDIDSVGSDLHGFFVRITSYSLPDDLSTNTAFKYLRQNGLNTPTSQKPTFYPDVAGIYKFDLTVSNGTLFSETVSLIANVVASAVAAGCTTDVSFLWNYLSDFWNLVEGTERITAFWQGLTQVAAAELLNLWQADYSKSLRDIQRTFQRKWLHYDLLMQEDVSFSELTTVRAVYAGIESSDIPTAGVGGVAGTHLDISIAGQATPTIILIGGQNPFTANQIAAALDGPLAQIDSRFAVHVIPRRDSTSSRVRIDAPFPFSILPSSTMPLYAANAQNTAPTGTMGSAIGVQTYRCDKSLQFLDIELNDFLCIDGVAYRIASVVDNINDPYSFMRVTLLDVLPTPADMVWSISGTVVSQDLNFWLGMTEIGDEAVFEITQTTTFQTLNVTCPVLGSSSVLTGNLPVDATLVGQYVANPTNYTVFLQGVLRHKYIPADPLVVDVPQLQEFIVTTDTTSILHRNVDYFLETFRGLPCIRFMAKTPLDPTDTPDVWQNTSPPPQMWAEYTYLDNRPVIEANFGVPANFTLDDLSQLPSNVDYLSCVQGLWYAYFNGPTVFNLRVGTQILLGLPFAEVAGTITEIRSDFSATQGRILVSDLTDSTIVRSYTYPVSLALATNPATNLPFAVGDTVTQFQPLVTGVEVLDYVNTPTWFGGYLEQGAFFEVEKFFKFLVRVNSEAFNLSALLFVQSFVLLIKPTYTYPLFVVLEQIGNTEVSVSDEMVPEGILSLYAGACFDGSGGEATMWDQPNPAGGGWMSQYDAAPGTTPTFPTQTYPILWGFDKKYLCPEDLIVGTASVTFGASTLPSYDSIFQFDLPVFTNEAGIFQDGNIYQIPTAAPGRQIGLPVTMGAGGTLDTIELYVECDFKGSPATYNLIIQKNGTTVSTNAFTAAQPDFTEAFSISVPVLTSDVITVFIQSTSGVGTFVNVEWPDVVATIGQAVAWAFDVALPAGTYSVTKEL